MTEQKVKKSRAQPQSYLLYMIMMTSLLKMYRAAQCVRHAVSVQL